MKLKGRIFFALVSQSLLRHFLGIIMEIFFKYVITSGPTVGRKFAQWLTIALHKEEEGCIRVDNSTLAEDDGGRFGCFFFVVCFFARALRSVNGCVAACA